MKRFYCSVLLVLFPAISYAQYSANKPIQIRAIPVPIPADSLGRINDLPTKIAIASNTLSYSRETINGIAIRIIPVPVLNDSLGKINDYTTPISKKIANASKKLSRQTLTLAKVWKQVELRMIKEMQKSDSNRLQELVTIPSAKFKELDLTLRRKHVKITNNQTPEYLDSLSIRLDYINRHILHGAPVNISDLRTALSILANDFDYADSIRNYIQGRSLVLNNSFKADKNYATTLLKLGEKLKRYDAKVVKIKERLRFPLKAEIAYNVILERDARYQSFMQEKTQLGERYGIFGRLR